MPLKKCPNTNLPVDHNIHNPKVQGWFHNMLIRVNRKFYYENLQKTTHRVKIFSFPRYLNIFMSAFSSSVPQLWHEYLS